MPRKIEVDISEILVRPEALKPLQVPVDSELSTFPITSDAFFESPEYGISPSGWTNINFVAISAAIALFCAVFIRDSFEYSRQTAHLPADASDLKPEFGSTKPHGFTLERSRLAAALQLDRFKPSQADVTAAPSSENSTLSTLPQFHLDQNLASSSISSSALGNASSTNNSTAESSESSGPSRVSRSTSTRAETSSGGEQASSKHSSLRTISRHSRTSVTSSQAAISGGRHNVQRSLANGVRSVGANNSSVRATRQNVNAFSETAHNGQSHAAKSQIASPSSLMSMHSLGNGAGLRLGHGAMNPMRMESGMLAQPGIGAGLGGVSGNGLGGGGGGNHGGNRAAK